MEVAGFADPTQDAQKADISLWDANLSMVPIDLSVEKSKFLLGQVGYKFCELFHQEKEAYFEHMSEGKCLRYGSMGIKVKQALFDIGVQTIPSFFPSSSCSTEQMLAINQCKQEAHYYLYK